MGDYLSPVPATLQGAIVVDVLDTRQLHEQGDTVFIDVLPAQRKPEGLQETDIWLPKPHKNIPGSAWLPDVGLGVISEQMENYFTQNLQVLTGDEKSKKNSDLLPRRLLDVLECRETGVELWLHQAILVSRWNGWLVRSGV